MLARMRFDYPDQMLARVAVVNGDGTYDCDRPGTDIYMSAVPLATMDLLAHIVKGATVRIKFYKRNRQLPRIVAVAGYSLEAFVRSDWSCARGNPRQNFLAGSTGDMIAIATATAPTLLDNQTLSGLIFGILHLANPVGNDPANILAVKNYPAGFAGTANFRDEFVAYDPSTGVASAADYLFQSQVDTTDSHGVRYLNCFGAWHYCEALGLLIFARRRNPSFSVNASEILVIDAVSGSTIGATPVTDGSAVTPAQISLVDFVADEGLVVCGEILVKTYHRHTYNHTHDGTSIVSTTDSMNDTNKSIVALSLPALEQQWAWDCNKIWNGTTTFPALRELVEPAKVLATDNGATTALNNLSSSDPYMYGFGTGLLLPGNPGCYLASKRYVVFPLVGRVCCQYQFETWSNPATSETLIRPVPLGQQTPPAGGVNALSECVYYTGYWTSGAVSGVISGSAVAVGNVPFLKYRNGIAAVVSPVPIKFPRIGVGNSTALHSWLVALNVESASTEGEVAWSYELPVLEAANNYVLDQDSFDKVPGSAWVAKLLTDAGSIGTTVSGSTEVVHPDQAYMLTDDGVGNKTFGVRTATLESYLYWPAGASYYWDPMHITSTGDNNQNSTGATNSTGPNRTQTNVVADSDDNVYGCYLAPKLFISCAHLHHFPDASVADRTHSADTVYSTTNNGYEADRLTLKPDRVDVWFLVPSNLQATAYGIPNKFICFRSYLASWDSSGTLRWRVELTDYHNERVDTSPGLAGAIPYPGCTLRIIPTSVGVFVLRLRRLPIKTTLREAALLPAQGYSSSSKGGNTDFVLHTYNSEAVLELRSAEDGSLTWRQTIYDPTSLGDSWMASCCMVGSESDTGPWVFGRVDFSTDYTAKNNWMDNPATHAGLTRVTKIFTCDKDGNLTTRNVNGTQTDVMSQGVYPYNFTSGFGLTNGQIRQWPVAMAAGQVYYPTSIPGGAGKQGVYRYGG